MIENFWQINSWSQRQKFKGIFFLINADAQLKKNPKDLFGPTVFNLMAAQAQGQQAGIEHKFL